MDGTGDVPETVRIEIRGSAAQLSSAASPIPWRGSTWASIGSPGERTFTISESNLNLPRGVTFLRAVPSQLRLRIARLANKEVPVEVRITGTAAARISDWSATMALPPTCASPVPKRASTPSSSVETDAIDLDGLTQSVDRRVNAFVADPASPL